MNPQNSSRKAESLSEWTNNIEKNVKSLQEDGRMMVRKHQKSNIKSSTFAKDLRDVSARETCPTMKDALSSLATAVDRGEQSREVILSELQSHMVQCFETYEDKLKVQEMGIVARNKAVKKYVAKLKDYQNASLGRNEKKIAHTRDVMVEERKRMVAAEETLNKSVGDFEKKRLTDLQNYLKKYVRSQLYFFAAEMQELSAIYANICSINPEQEQMNWVSALKAQELPDVLQSSPRHGPARPPLASPTELNSPSAYSPAASASPSPLSSLPASSPSASPMSSPNNATYGNAQSQQTTYSLSPIPAQGYVR